VCAFGNPKWGSLRVAIENGMIENLLLGCIWLMVGILLFVMLHELIHGFVMRIFGAQPKYGVIWKSLILYATAPGYAFTRNQYLVFNLAPLVSLSILVCCGILIQAGSFNVWFWAFLAMTNAASSTGDLWLTAILLRYPSNAYVVDEKDGMRVFLPNNEVGDR
jgi:hypothetical protein